MLAGTQKAIRGKRYREKFKEWGFMKNLPSNLADWMVSKAEKRKTEDNKDTIFRVAGEEWDVERARTAADRSKRRRKANPESRCSLRRLKSTS